MDARGALLPAEICCMFRRVYLRVGQQKLAVSDRDSVRSPGSGDLYGIANLIR